MISAVNVSIQAITGKDSLSECSVSELRKVIDTYPYFGPAHLLLTQKFKEENAAQYSEQIQRTSLYFQNPLWLDLLVHGPAISVEELKEISIENNNTEPPVTEIETATNDEEVIEQQEESTPKTVSPLLTIPSLKIEPLKEADKEMSFQPYHTVDYFASQGIKIKEEPKPDDKFGKQLKSFTEWLKTLKKLPDTAPSTVSSTGVPDQKVEQMAEKSIVGENAVTEAMAEVWEKQGNKDRAIEIYTKLSLSDPAKSSYFAAKIEQLKNL